MLLFFTALKIKFAESTFTTIQIIIATIDITNAIIDASFFSLTFSLFNIKTDNIIAIIEDISENGIPKRGTKEQTNAKILPTNEITYILYPLIIYNH